MRALTRTNEDKAWMGIELKGNCVVFVCALRPPLNHGLGISVCVMCIKMVGLLGRGLLSVEPEGLRGNVLALEAATVELLLAGLPGPPYASYHRRAVGRTTGHLISLELTCCQ